MGVPKSPTEQKEIQKYGCTKAERDRIQRAFGGKRWQKTPFGVFSQQRRNAIQRGIPWRLKFQDWWDVWYYSGRWFQRGPREGQYCMARLCNEGAYEIGNVYIVRAENYKQEISEMRWAGVTIHDTGGTHMTKADWEKIRELEEKLP